MDTNTGIAVATVALAGATLIGYAGYGIASFNHVETRTCTVESKDRTSKPKGGSDMRVYTIECGILEVGDSLLDGSFDASDRWQAIEEGERYRFTTRGWRVPPLSAFPNIIKAEEA